jgi:hypothetical protein
MTRRKDTDASGQVLADQSFGETTGGGFVGQIGQYKQVRHGRILMPGSAGFGLCWQTLDRGGSQ